METELHKQHAVSPQFERSRKKRFKFVPPISCASLKILQKNYDKLKKSQVYQQPRNFMAYVLK